MILFRDHRGSLTESMTTVRRVSSLEEIRQHITKKWGTEVKEIRIKPYGFDSRIGWDTHIVICTLSSGMETPVGFTNKYIK